MSIHTIVYGARLPRGYNADRSPFGNGYDVYSVGANGEAYVAGSDVKRTYVGSIEQLTTVGRMPQYAVTSPADATSQPYPNAERWTVVEDLLDAFRALSLDDLEEV